MKTNTERQQSLRVRRAALGQYRREHFLTDYEAVAVNSFIVRLRKRRAERPDLRK